MNQYDNNAAQKAQEATLEDKAQNYALDPEKARKTASEGLQDEMTGIENLHRGAPAVYIMDNFFDALQLDLLDQPAVALGSPDNIQLMIMDLEDHRTGSTLIICLKDPGELPEALDRLNVPYILSDLRGKYGSAFDFSHEDPEGFAEAVRAARSSVSKPDSIANYLKGEIWKDFDKMRAAADKKTGFSNLDDQAGGLYPGLYVIAATSSLGKTTFSLQLADQLATAGHDVLFFSLEQSRLELVSKSIARTLYVTKNKSISSLQIRAGLQTEETLDALREYSEAIGDRLNIIEGNFRCDVSYICDKVRQYTARNQCRPVVFIDYLQILQAGEGKKASVRETIDNTVTELKRLSRDLDLTIFVISSVNRTNYLTPIDFESLKESGGIEYTADVVWGLQLRCLNDDLFSTDSKTKVGEKRERIREEKAKTPRELELVCLKNRYGISSYSCSFDYYPGNDYFKEHYYEGPSRVDIPLF